MSVENPPGADSDCAEAGRSGQSEAPTCLDPSKSRDSSSSPIASAQATVAHSARIPHAGHFYRVDSSRTSFIELWRDTRSPVVLIAWLSKLLRVKLPGSVNDPNVVSLLPFLIADQDVAETIPLDVLRRFEPIQRELEGLGFRAPIYFFIDDRFHRSRTIQAALLHRDGRSVARITHRTEGAAGSKKHFFSEFISPLQGGSFLWSSSARAQLLPPPACRLNYHPQATTSQLWVFHRQELDALGTGSRLVQPASSRRDMLELLEKHHEAVQDFQLQRGVFSSMQGDDLAHAAELDRNLEEARAGRMRFPEVMAHLEKLQRKKTSWTSTIIVLIISVGLFIGAGAGVWNWSWETLLMIIGILFVHETGHYLTMKVFRYRNVRMFFIPFFGAAVSGQHYSAPGWKKVIVSLMGPLPGIFLGGLLGIAGVIKGNDAWTQAAMLAIILNAFNLLPVLPLDGGRVMHAVLFSRNYYLDTAFHALAAAALAAIGALVGDRILLYLGLFMLWVVPMAYKSARIAVELRGQGFNPRGAPAPLATPAAAPTTGSLPYASAAAAPQPAAALTGLPARPIVTPGGPVTAPADFGECSIPPAAAETIIERVQARFPRLKSPRNIAEMTLRVYESLATRPPGIVASIAFLLLYGASFLIALVLLALIVVGRQGGFAADPRYDLDPATVASWYASSAGPDGGPADPKSSTAFDDLDRKGSEKIIATFATQEEARQEYEQLRQTTPAADLVAFGQTVCIALPASDDLTRIRLLSHLEQRAEDVFVDSRRFPTWLTLVCRAPSVDKAQAIENESENYFQAAEMLCLIPPWSDHELDRRTDNERLRHETARAIHRTLGGTRPTESPEMQALSDELARAARRNDEVEYQQLLKKRAILQDQLRTRELERIRDRAEGSIERELADLYVRLHLAEQTEHAASSMPARPVEDAEPVAEESAERLQKEDFARQWWDRTRRRREELAPLMGRLPLPADGSRPPPETLRYSAAGYAERAAAKVTFSVTFRNVFVGAPALVQWLQSRGCTGFKYEFSSDSDDDDYD